MLKVTVFQLYTYTPHIICICNSVFVFLCLQFKEALWTGSQLRGQEVTINSGHVAYILPDGKQMILFELNTFFSGNQ